MIKKIFKLNYNIIKNGTRKGQLNTKKKKIKFVFRSLLSFNESKEIGEYILNHKYLKEKVLEYPIILSKIHRPYLHKNLKGSKKAASILESYNFIEDSFSEKVKDELFKNGEYLLSEIEGKDGAVFKIYLSIYTFYDKEGELNIRVVDENMEVLSTITFGILDGDIFIGGVQGARKDIDQEYIKEATKKMYGLFPKKINIEAVYALKNALNLECDILATSNELHVYKSKRYIKKRVINSNYDDFRSSLGGEKKGGIWTLPKKSERKNIEDVPSKKRGQTLKKYGLLDTVYSNISLD